MPQTKLPGIFCLEGEWSADLAARESVRPLLQLLEQLGVAKAIHRDVATRDELDYYISKWCQRRYVDYSVLYLASHGGSNELHLGKDTITLEELGERIEGKAAGRVIYFGSCLTLLLEDERLRDFVRKTGAKAVVGYYKEIDWLEAASFELLLLERLTRGARSDAFFRHLNRDHGKHAADLGLVVATKSIVYDARVD